jgi:hypothetical protein
VPVTPPCHANSPVSSLRPCRAPDDAADASNVRHYIRHPQFPDLPASVPLIYVLTMKACLSELVEERPPFSDLTVLLEDTASEVDSGSYINSEGMQQARSCSRRSAKRTLRLVSLQCIVRNSGVAGLHVSRYHASNC